MADLDDFFAKKDKKKKNKNAFSKANTEVIAKNLEEQENREKDRDNENAAPLATTLGNQASLESEKERSGANANEGKDEEWYDYETPTKDYTDLKIQALKVMDEMEEEEAENEEETDEDGIKIGKGKKDGSVWSKNNNAFESNTKCDDEPAPVVVVAAPAPAQSTGKYLPPHLRNQTDSNNHALIRPRKTKAAPDINNQAFFPSLSSSNSAIRTPRGDDFEEVKGGSNSQHSHKSEAPRLALGNKFSALGD